MDRRGRTGCLTCRSRRIKCDEGKPTCKRCHIANFLCEGYEAPRKATKVVLRPTSSVHRGTRSLETIKPEIPWRHSNWRQDQLPFYHHFVTSTVVRLFMVDHIGFWRDQVAQMSYDVDVVYEALVAIGAVHRASLLSSSENNVLEVARCKVLGLTAYGKALSLLASNEHTSTIACFMENPGAALSHLWVAIQILKSSQTPLSAIDISNMVPIHEVVLRLDFLAQKLVPYSASSYFCGSNLALTEVPFWNRQPGEYSGVSESDTIITERHRLIQLVCGHNRLSRVIWGCWSPTSERPSRDELMGFYNEMLLWKATSPATFSGFPGLGDNDVSSTSDFHTLPIPPNPLNFTSGDAAINIIMFNGYLGCALSMIGTTDEDPLDREIESFNIAYQNLCVCASLIHQSGSQASGSYKPCDAWDMGISMFLYHGARRCFSLDWQKWTIAALRNIGREGLSNGHASANTLEIMCQLEMASPHKTAAENYATQQISPLGSIRDRVIPLLMPRSAEDPFLAYFLRYGVTDMESDEKTVRIIARATWKQSKAGTMQDLALLTYKSALHGEVPLPRPPSTMSIFPSWRRLVEHGWHGFLSPENIHASLTST